MKHRALYCKKCKTVIFSRAQHDFAVCDCGACAIDSGFDTFSRVRGKEENYTTFAVNLPRELTKKVLYDDWNKSLDKHGFYKDNEYPRFVKEGLKKVNLFRAKVWKSDSWRN